MHTIRLLADSANPSKTQADVTTGRRPFWWRGSDVRFSVALVENGRFLVAADIGEIIVEVKRLGAQPAEDCLMRKTYVAGDCDGTFTGADWAAGDRQLLEAEFTFAEAALVPGSYLFIVRHVAASGIQNTFINTEVLVLEDGSDSSILAAPPAIPGEYWDRFQDLVNAAAGSASTASTKAGEASSSASAAAGSASAAQSSAEASEFFADASANSAAYIGAGASAGYGIPLQLLAPPSNVFDPTLSGIVTPAGANGRLYPRPPQANVYTTTLPGEPVQPGTIVFFVGSKWILRTFTGTGSSPVFEWESAAGTTLAEKPFPWMETAWSAVPTVSGTPTGSPSISPPSATPGWTAVVSPGGGAPKTYWANLGTQEAPDWQEVAASADLFVKKSGGNIISDEQTFTGPVKMTGLDLSDPTSAINVGQADARYSPIAPIWLSPPRNATSDNTGAGQVRLGPTGALLNFTGAATIGDYAVISWSEYPSYAQGSGQRLNMGSHRWSMRFSTSGTSSDGSARYALTLGSGAKMVGEDSTVLAGVIFENNTARLAYHNGTSLAESDPAPSLSGSIYHWMLVLDGGVALKLYSRRTNVNGGAVDWAFVASLPLTPSDGALAAVGFNFMASALVAGTTHSNMAITDIQGCHGVVVPT